MITNKEIEDLRKKAENVVLDFGGLGGVETFVPHDCIVVPKRIVLALIEELRK
jgi:hypothetical protein